MVDFCTLSGTLVAPDGQAFGLARVILRPKSTVPSIATSGSIVAPVVPEPAVTDEDGGVSLRLAPGYYKGDASIPSGKSFVFDLAVPDLLSAPLEDYIGAIDVEVQTSAQKARDDAQAAAEVAQGALDEIRAGGGPVSLGGPQVLINKTILSLLLTGAPRANGLTAEGLGQFLTDLKLGPVFASRAEALAPSSGQTGSAWTISVVNGSGALLTYIYDADGTALITGDGRHWSPGGVPHPRHWGAPLNGVDDDTGALRALHTYANGKQLEVSYAGVAVISVEADAQIVVNTSVDWAGVVIRARNGFVATPSASTTTYMFRIFDADTPVETGSATSLTATNLQAGSRTPTADFFLGMGYCLIYANGGTGRIIPGRDRATPREYLQGFAVTKLGVAATPLAVSISGATSLFYRRRAMSPRGRITLRNINIDPTTFNSACIIHIERNNVEVTDVQVLPAPDDPNTFNRIIAADDAAWVMVRNVTATAQPTGGDGGGTYLLRFRNCAEIIWENVNGVQGWGATGCDEINGLYVENCNLNRIDTHSGAFNIWVNNSTLQEIGCRFGWGGGFYRITNSVFFNCPAISTRPDYGGFFFGDIMIVGNQFESSAFQIKLASLGGDTPIGVSGFDLPSCYSMMIANNQVSALDTGSYREVMAFEFKINPALAAGGIVRAPRSVVIDGIDCGGNWRLTTWLDYENAIKDAGQNDVPRFALRDCSPSAKVISEAGSVYVPPNVVAGAGSAVDISVDNVKNCSLNTSASARCTHQLTNSTWTHLKVGTNRKTRINGGALLEPTLFGAEVKSPLGSGMSGVAELYTALLNVGVESSAWDLSTVAISSGTYMRAGITPTLPSGATATTMFTGFQKSGF
jgi:hypothetical protein